MHLKQNRDGFSLIESVMALGLIVLSSAAVYSYMRSYKRALLNAHVRSEWQLMNFTLDNLFKETLLCEKTSLVRSGDVNQIKVLPRTTGSGGFTSMNQEIMTLSAIDYSPNPSGVRVKVAEVAGGKFFEITSIKVSQVWPVIDAYKVTEGTAIKTINAAPIKITISARARHLQSKTMTATHQLTVDIYSDTLLGRSCYTTVSRRRLCEQLGKAFLPINPSNPTVGAICS